MPRPEEVCEVAANGQKFRDWTTVAVRCCYAEVVREAAVTLVEPGELSKSYAQLRLKAGDIAAVRLAGYDVIDGYIVERNTSYDANRHGVRVTIESKATDLVKSAVDTKLSGAQFKKQSFDQIAKKVLEPHGLSFTWGKVEAEAKRAFDNVVVPKGQAIFPFLERLARMRGFIINSDKSGNLIGGVPNDVASVKVQLEEGRNILQASCRIKDLEAYKRVEYYGQQPGSDAQWGKPSSQVSAKAENPNVKNNRLLIILGEHSGDQKDAQTRTDQEAAMRGAETVEANITVQGWLQDDGTIWKPGQDVSLYSPMLIPEQGGRVDLKLMAVTFTQNPQQTVSVLELVSPNVFGQRFRNANTTPGDPFAGSGGPSPAQPEAPR